MPSLDHRVSKLTTTTRDCMKNTQMRIFKMFSSKEAEKDLERWLSG